MPPTLICKPSITRLNRIQPKGCGNGRDPQGEPIAENPTSH